MFPIEVFIAPDILLIANYFLNIFWIFSKMKTSRVYHDLTMCGSLNIQMLKIKREKKLVFGSE